MPLKLKVSRKPDLKQDAVTVSIHLASENPFLFKLKLDERLSTIRKELKVDKKLLFFDKVSFIESETEDGFKLRDIVKKEGSQKTYQLYLSYMLEDVVAVSVHPALEEPFLAKLKLDDNLPTIRDILKLDKRLLFLGGDSFIKSEKEGEFKLREIVKKEGPEKTYQIYLKVKVWEYLNEKYRLDHGCKAIDDEISRAEKRAFTMIDCKVSYFSPPKYLAVKNDNKDIRTAEKSLSVNVDPGIIGSFGISGNIGNGTETNSSDETIYYFKSCLEFEKYLEPTKEFIEEVNDLKNSKKFKEIIEKFGQFIPTKIIMGGKIHKEEDGTLKNKSKGYSANAGININMVNIGAGISSSDSKESASQYRKESYDGIGKSDDEESRNESLSDEKNWACIRHENCINIFELLTNNPKYNYLREKIFSAIGQRILYSDIETCYYTLNGSSRKPHIGRFENIPSNILKEEADFCIFAIILDAKGKKNDFFNCQICLQNGTPMYIIHCIQPDRQFFPNFSTASLGKCELKIKYMIVGNYTDFNSIKYDELNSDIRLEVIKKDNNNNHQTKCSNGELLGFKLDPFVNFIGIPVLKDFYSKIPIIGHHFYTDQNDNVGVFTFSYSLDQKKYVNLPDFNFYTLKISNLKREQFDYNNYQTYNEIINHPKYFSLHSENGFGPIFFKYTINQIKLKVIDCGCKDCCVCKNSLKIPKEKINFVYFNLPGEIF